MSSNIDYLRKKFYKFRDKNSFNLCDLFDTSDCSAQTILDFVQTNSDYQFMPFLSFVFNEDYNKLYEYKIDSINKFSTFLSTYFDRYKSLFRLIFQCFCGFCLMNEKVSQGTEIISKRLKVEDIENYNKNSLYRGQSNSNWGLVPSMFRNNQFIDANSDGDYISIERIYDLYDKSGLIDKANNSVFENKKINKTNIDYGFLSYMQHAVAYSPLIDLTSKFPVAINFALCNKSSFNDYNLNNAVVYEFNIARNNIVYELSKTFNETQYIKILKGKIKPGTIEYLTDSNGNRHSVDFTSIANIIQELTPSYAILDYETNDRMRYQHGKFIFFYNYLLVCNRIMFQLNPTIRVTQYIIEPNKKNQIRNYLHNNFEQYDIDYLMDPYMYFGK